MAKRFKYPNSSPGPYTLHFFVRGVGERRETIVPGQVVEGDHFGQFAELGILYEIEAAKPVVPVVAAVPEKPVIRYNPVVGVADKMAEGMAAFASVRSTPAPLVVAPVVAPIAELSSEPPSRVDEPVMKGYKKKKGHRS